jgi:hypothetical protein
MTDKHEEIEIPAGPFEPKKPPREPFFLFDGADELRDTSKPLFYDEHGLPVYGPRGIVLRWPG